MTLQALTDAADANDAFDVRGELVDIGNERHYRIVHYDTMAPFLMSLASDTDRWMFVSSTGALTAGRRDADTALFPYYTDDRIHDSRDLTGAKTILKIARAGKMARWEPFSARAEETYNITRALAKSVYGNKLTFEEVNHDLGLCFRSTWTSSNRFGFVRRASLRNLADEAVMVLVLDGLQNLMPAGLTRRFQLDYSTLADGYKESERHPATGLGLFRLSSIPADQPMPQESLRATTVWCEGLTPEKYLLSTAQLERFRRGSPVETESFVRGQRGAYLVQSAFALLPGQVKQWSHVADVAQDAVAVAKTQALLTSCADLRAELDADIARGTDALIRVVAAADGLQATGDEADVWRHFSNTLFNVMRGGIPAQGYRVGKADLQTFVAKANRSVAVRQAAFLGGLPQTIERSALLAAARAAGDPHLERLCYEYLPLTFSRRHGDPSRPWNVFSIDVRDGAGQPILNYQGNWRDIFQNWEALAGSYPGLAGGMIFKFLDATTADGYNPYRIARDGFEWEVLDPHDTWSYIGYWGDHQVVYLLRLLEAAADHDPAALPQLLTRRLFTYANVPYRIRPYGDICRDPRNTIDFDAALNHEIERRVAAMGADGKALLAPDGLPHRVTLAEKLAVVLLAKFFNYVPEAGLWMNTQRPEWNDANNALVGYGASVVTLCYLRRFLLFARDLCTRTPVPAVEMSSLVAGALGAVTQILQQHSKLLNGPISDGDRQSVRDLLGAAGGRYRASLYAGGLDGFETVPVAALAALCDAGLGHVDHAIRANRRSDGLYHAYNLMEPGPGGVTIRRLPEMLEGQVAVLSSGVLSIAQSLDLLDALRASALYRPDQDSYLLYPDKKLPGFFEKNNIPPGALDSLPSLAAMVGGGDTRIVARDCLGVLHFNADISNATDLAKMLAPLPLPAGEGERIVALYEAVFDHKSFTGRSGSFYKYEGLGCIYWHMVSKLALAVQDVMKRALREAPGLQERARAHYEAIRAGIGTHKPPAVYGAVPLDPYSHTPSFAGVQQPGMTGQVKEDIIARFGDMGVEVCGGAIVFARAMVRRQEFLTKTMAVTLFDVDGQPQHLEVMAGAMAFTLCQVPVVLHAEGTAAIDVCYRDGTKRRQAGLVLDAATSAAIFARDGSVRRLDVGLGLGRD